MYSMDFNIILGLVASIFTILLVIYGGFRFIVKRRKFKIEKKNADKNYAEKNYSFAISQYSKLILNLHHFTRFDRGELYSHLGHCILENPQYTKDYTKLLEGKHYLEIALSYYNFKNRPLSILLLGTLNVAEYLKIFKLLSLFNIREYQLLGKLTKSLKAFGYLFRYAGIYNDIGILYSRLAEIRNPLENIQNAILSYNEALSLYKFERYPIDHVLVSENLITTYRNLIRINESEYYLDLLSKLIDDTYSKTQRYPELFDVKEDTIENARLKQQAGDFLREMFELNPKVSNGIPLLKASIDCYLTALSFYNVEEYPYENGLINNNIGIAYQHLSIVTNSPDLLETSKKHFSDSLQIRRKDNFPIEYAQTSFNLGLLYQKISIQQKEKMARNESLLNSIQKFKESLEIRNLSEYPREFAESHLHLANSYYLMSQIDSRKEQCLKLARHSLDEAGKIITDKGYPRLYSHLLCLKDIIGI